MNPSARPPTDPARATVDRRRFLGLALGAAGAVVAGPTLLAACGGGSSGSRVTERHADGILRIGVAGAPSNINPLDSGSELTRWLAEPVVETLYTYDEDLRSVPLLAVGEPEVSEDLLTWTVRLRDDVTFQNGDPLTADDVIATLDHMLNLSAGSEWITYLIDYVQRFDKVDDHTFTIGLAKPYGLLRSHLTNLPICHRDYVERRDAMMGTGPFGLDGFTPGQSFRLSRHDGYWGAEPRFEGIEYTVFVDGNTRLVSLRQGKVDLITAVPYQNLRTVERDDELALILADAPLDVLTYVNLFVEPFSDEDFRRAVAVSMDRAGVRDRVYGGHATIGQGPIGPAELGWDPDLDVFAAEPDRAEAERLLGRAKTDVRGFTITIGTSQTGKEVAAVLAAGWAEVGLDVKIEQLAGGPWSGKWLANEYEMLMNTFQSGFTSGPANYLTLAPAHSKNLLSCGYVDEELDGWMDLVWSTSDEPERAATLAKITRRLAEAAVIFPPGVPEAGPGPAHRAEPARPRSPAHQPTAPRDPGVRTRMTGAPPLDATPPVLEVAGLHVTYASPLGPVAAVRGVSFDLGAGEVLGLVGESGSGKSSVCGAALGLLGGGATVTADRLALEGDDLTRLDARGWTAVRGRRIALIPQQPMTALAASVAVGRQLDWHLGAAAVSRHAEALVDLGLQAVVDRPRDLPDAFSGGQLQRLVIAIATLAHTPSVLLADEPTSTLDATVQANVLDLLAELRTRLGLSMLYVSHDLAVVAQICDRVGVMRGGDLVELATVEELFADPQHPYTQRLVASLPSIGHRRAAAPAAAAPTVPAVPVLEIERLYHYYGRRKGPGGPPPGLRVAAVVRAVDEVDLRIGDGRTTALVGESGSGKTTLARAVAGQLAPTAGTIRLDGRELGTERSLADRRLVQLVTQNPRTALNRRRHLAHALEQAQRVHGIGDSRSDRADRSREVLARVGLPADHLVRRPTELSGGELARAVLARSLLLSPRLLLLDEPTASLDALVKAQVLELLGQLRKELSLTVLLITHELPTARALADDVAVMHHGRLVEQGPADAVFEDPQDDYTRTLLASVPPDPRPVGA